MCVCVNQVSERVSGKIERLVPTKYLSRSPSLCSDLGGRKEGVDGDLWREGGGHSGEGATILGASRTIKIRPMKGCGTRAPHYSYPQHLVMAR